MTVQDFPKINSRGRVTNVKAALHQSTRWIAMTMAVGMTFATVAVATSAPSSAVTPVTKKVTSFPAAPRGSTT